MRQSCRSTIDRVEAEDSHSQEIKPVVCEGVRRLRQSYDAYVQQTAIVFAAIRHRQQNVGFREDTLSNTWEAHLRIAA